MSKEIDRLSASGVKSFGTCPKKFGYKYAYRLDVPDKPEPEHFAVGNTIHDSCEEVLKQDGVASLSEEEIFYELRKAEESLKYEYDDNKKVKNCLKFASKFIDKYVKNVISVEDELTMNEAGFDFIGYADLVADIQDGNDVFANAIVDWKSGEENPEWKEKIQGGMYVKMFYEEFGMWPEAIFFIYLDEGTKSVHRRVDDGEVLWNNHHNEYWSEIKKYISDIKNAAYREEWEAKPDSENCYFCDYKYACSDYIGSEKLKPKHINL